MNWISVKDTLPNDCDKFVLAIANGKPCQNITFEGAYVLASYSPNEGWIVEDFPMWEEANVTHWMPLPSAEGLDDDA